MTSSHTYQARKRILVVGAGLIGMSCALRLSQAGNTVVLIDKKSPATGASWAAAGMLAPAFEAADEPKAHPYLFDLCMEGARVWRDFAPRLQSFTDTSLDYYGMGSLACAVNGTQEAELAALEQACIQKDVPVRRLTASRAQIIEPCVSGSLQSALLLPTDQQIDNWAAIGAMMQALAETGVRLIPNWQAESLTRSGSGWLVGELGRFDRIVWTAGIDSGMPIKVDGEAQYLIDPEIVIPVKGQMMALEPGKGTPKHVLRFGAGYIAPKSERVVVGATSEWGVHNREVVEQDIVELREAASEICPQLAQVECKMSWAGVRPGTPDHAPIIGWSHIDGIAIATGHYRNGILLAPYTGDIVSRLLADQDLSVVEQSFSPSRFKQETQSSLSIAT